MKTFNTTVFAFMVVFIQGRSFYKGRQRLTLVGKKLPLGQTLGSFFIYAIVAQLVEQWTENPCVAGSIPAYCTKYGTLVDVVTTSV